MKLKKVLCFVLAFIMLAGLMPALAPEAEATPELGFSTLPEQNNYVPLDGTATIRWSYDFDPADYSGVSLYLTREDGVNISLPLEQEQTMTVYPSFISEKPYYLKIAVNSEVVCVSPAFYIKQSYGFIRQPQNVEIAEGASSGTLQ